MESSRKVHLIPLRCRGAVGLRASPTHPDHPRQNSPSSLQHRPWKAKVYVSQLYSFNCCWCRLLFVGFVQCAECANNPTGRPPFPFLPNLLPTSELWTFTNMYYLTNDKLNLFFFKFSNTLFHNWGAEFTCSSCGFHVNWVQSVHQAASTHHMTEEKYWAASK